MPFVTPGTLADGSFCTSSTSPVPLPVSALPISGWWLSTTFATLAEGRLAGRVGDRHGREVLRRAERQHRADLDPLVGPVEEAAGPRRRALEVGERRDELRVARRVDDLLQRDVLRRELRRVDLDLDLAVLLAEDRDVRDARDARTGAA